MIPTWRVGMIVVAGVILLAIAYLAARFAEEMVNFMGRAGW